MAEGIDEELENLLSSYGVRRRPEPGSVEPVKPQEVPTADPEFDSLLQQYKPQTAEPFKAPTSATESTPPSENVDPELEALRAQYDSSPLPEFKPTRGYGQAFMDAVERGFRSLQATPQTLGAVAAEASGDIELSRQRMAQAQEIEDRAPKPVSDDYEAALIGLSKGEFNRFSYWATEKLGEQIPNLVASLTGGGLGAVAGRMTARGLLSSPSARALQLYTGSGAGVGGYAVSTGLETADTAKELYDATGSTHPGVSGVAGAAKGALEFITPWMLTRRLLGGAPIASSLPRAIGKTAGLEGATEASQELLGATAREYADPNYNFFSKQTVLRVAESATAGALVGGVFGGGGEIIGRRLNRDERPGQREVDDNELAQRFGVSPIDRLHEIGRLQKEAESFDVPTAQMAAEGSLGDTGDVIRKLTQFRMEHAIKKLKENTTTRYAVQLPDGSFMQKFFTDTDWEQYRARNITAPADYKFYEVKPESLIPAAVTADLADLPPPGDARIFFLPGTDANTRVALEEAYKELYNEAQAFKEDSLALGDISTAIQASYDALLSEGLRVAPSYGASFYYTDNFEGIPVDAPKSTGRSVEIAVLSGAGEVLTSSERRRTGVFFTPWSEVKRDLQPGDSIVGVDFNKLKEGDWSYIVPAYTLAELRPHASFHPKVTPPQREKLLEEYLDKVAIPSLLSQDEAVQIAVENLRKKGIYFKSAGNYLPQSFTVNPERFKDSLTIGYNKDLDLRLFDRLTELADRFSSSKPTQKGEVRVSVNTKNQAYLQNFEYSKFVDYTNEFSKFLERFSKKLGLPTLYISLEDGDQTSPYGRAHAAQPLIQLYFAPFMRVLGRIDKANIFATLAHEYGHFLTIFTWSRLPQDTQEKVLAEYRQIVLSAGMPESGFNPADAVMLMYNADINEQANAYYTDPKYFYTFAEYLAEQFLRWSVSLDVEPMTSTEKFMVDVVKVLKQFAKEANEFTMQFPLPYRGVPQTQFAAMMEELFANQRGVTHPALNSAPQYQDVTSETLGKLKEAIARATEELKLLPRDTQIQIAEGLTVPGAYVGPLDVIKLSIYALDEPGGVPGVIAHEALHRLKALNIINEQEWALLVKYAKENISISDSMLQTYRRYYTTEYKRLGLSGQELLEAVQAKLDEEHVAFLVQYTKSGNFVANKDVRTLLDRIFAFIERLRNALRGMGFKTGEDVLRALMAGEITERYNKDLSRRERLEKVIERFEQGRIAEVTPAIAGFYSPAERAVRDFPQQKATRDQWKALLLKLPQDELRWMGVYPWLEEQSNVITKDSVLEFLAREQIDFFERPDDRFRDRIPHFFKTVETGRTANYRVFQFVVDDPAIQPYETHFDPDTLAHIRVADVYQDGKKYLYLMEVQSDRHQKAEDFGYIGEQSEHNWQTYLTPEWRDAEKRIEAEINKAIHKTGVLTKDTDVVKLVNDIKFMLSNFVFDTPYPHEAILNRLYMGNIKFMEYYRVWRGGVDEYENYMENNKKAVPDAPLKRGEWEQLGIKRALQLAAVENYDGLLWATPQEVSEAVGADTEGVTPLYGKRIGEYLKKYSTPLGGKIETFEHIRNNKQLDPKKVVLNIKRIIEEFDALRISKLELVIRFLEDSVEDVGFPLVEDVYTTGMSSPLHYLAPAAKALDKLDIFKDSKPLVRPVVVMTKELKQNLASGIPYYGLNKKLNKLVSPMFAGERAKLADLSALTRAQEMEAAGSSAEEIRQATGWFKRKDEKWRFELDISKLKPNMADSSKAKLSNETQEWLDRFNGSVDEALKDLKQRIGWEQNSVDNAIKRGREDQAETSRQHVKRWGKIAAELEAKSPDIVQGLQKIPDRWDKTEVSYSFYGKLGSLFPADSVIFKAYPQLRDIDVSIGSSGFGGGSFDEGKNRIYVKEGRSVDDVMEILVHEIQHVVQMYEGFGRGANPSSLRNRTEVAIFDLKQQLLNLPERSNIKPELENMLKELEAQVEHFSGGISGWATKPAELDAYTRVLGEVEARNASYRRGLTAEERRGWSPLDTEDIPADQQFDIDELTLLKMHNKDVIAEEVAKEYPSLGDMVERKEYYDETPTYKYFAVSLTPSYGDGIIEPIVTARGGFAETLTFSEQGIRDAIATHGTWALRRYLQQQIAYREGQSDTREVAAKKALDNIKKLDAMLARIEKRHPELGEVAGYTPKVADPEKLIETYSGKLYTKEEVKALEQQIDAKFADILGETYLEKHVNRRGEVTYVEKVVDEKEIGSLRYDFDAQGITGRYGIGKWETFQLFYRRHKKLVDEYLHAHETFLYSQRKELFSRSNVTLGDTQASISAGQRSNFITPNKIEKVSEDLYVAVEYTDAELAQYKFYTPPRMPLTGSLNEQLDALGEEVGAVLLTQNRKGFEVDNVYVNQSFRGNRMADRFYDYIERDLGITMKPSGILTPEGYKNWLKRNPSMVRYHVLATEKGVKGADDFYYSPNYIQDKVNFFEKQAARANSIYRPEVLKQNLAYWKRLRAKVDKRAWSDPQLEKMFSLSEKALITGVGQSMATAERLRNDEDFKRLQQGYPAESAGEPLFPVKSNGMTGVGEKLTMLALRINRGENDPEVRKYLQNTVKSADRLTKIGKKFIGLHQLAWRNPHIEELRQYLALTERWNARRMNWISRADTVARKWRKLDKGQPEALADYLFYLTEMEYRTPQEKGQNVIRQPTPLEIQAAVKFFKLDAKTFQLAQEIEAEFNAYLLDVERVSQLAIMREFSDPAARQKALNDLAAEMKALRSKPYFPMVRFGEWTITSRDRSNGKVVGFYTFPSQAERDAAVKNVALNHPGSRIQIGRMPEEVQEFLGLPASAIRAIKAKMPGLSKVQLNWLDQFEHLMAPERSFRKRWLKRKGTPGYSLDAQRAFAHYFMTGANYLARLEYKDEMQATIDLLTETSKVSVGSTDTRQLIIDYMQQHLNYIMEPGKDWSRLKSLIAVWYLGFSPAAAVTNLLQLGTFTFPYLSKQFGLAKTNGAMVYATNALKGMIAGENLKTSDPGYDAAHKELILQGKIDAGQAPELGAYADSDNLTRMAAGTQAQRAWRTFASAAMFMFAHVEKFNRELTFAMTYKLATENPKNKWLRDLQSTYVVEISQLQAKYGITFEQATAIIASREAIDRTQFIYSPWARAPLMRSAFGSTVLVFMQYMQSALYALGNNPGNKRSLLVLLALGGMMGLPGAEDLEALLTAIGRRWFGQDYNIKREVRNYVRDVTRGTLFDEIGPDLFLHGVSRYGFGISLLPDGWGAPRFDASANVSMGQIIPGFAEGFKQWGTYGKWDTTFEKVMKDVSGAGFGYFYNLTQFLMADPWTTDAKKWEKVLPRAAKAASRAVRYGYTGKETTPAGATFVTFDWQDPEDRATIIAQLIGFTPSAVSRKWEYQNMQTETENFYKGLRMKLYKDVDEAVRLDNKEALQKAVGAIQRYNANVAELGNPEFGISTSQLINSAKARTRNRVREESGLPRWRAQTPRSIRDQDLFPGVQFDVRVK